ncbi:MAG: thermopsin [Candidatus Thermoplasmatota archaeon]|nr:thermopsin [Candidatus Thermoplasmatota archaeon]
MTLHKETPSKALAIVAVVVALVLSSSYFFGTITDNNHPESKVSGQTNFIPNPGNTILPVGQQVSVNALYQKEPAPMGIADYGIGQNGVPYSYETSSFQGAVTVNSLQSVTSTTHSTEMTFQLNVNMYFFVNQYTFYVYWIQDVAALNTSNGNIIFIDNIWNVSSYGASMYNSTVLGNGTVGLSGSQYFYYDFANANLPGNNVTISQGTTFFMETDTFVNSQGFPEVDFLYNDGYGWVTYDNARLIFTTSLYTTPYFLVDGNVYQPNGVTFYDAELIMGGPGGGSQTELLTSDINLELKYWNGNNFQTIQNAFNFGSDTAEGVFNAVSAGYFDAGGGLFANVASGSGSLRPLWYSSSLADLNIYSNIENGTLILGGTSTTDFTGGYANISIYPGTYSIEIYNDAAGQLTSLGNRTFSAGAKYSIGAYVYEVEFHEIGLPLGSVWYVNVTGQSSSGPISGSTYFIALANSSYTYSIADANKNYYLPSATGSLTVAGIAITETLRFLEKTYPVTFIEQGLPSGQSWYVNLTNGESFGPITATSFAANLSNNSYSYYIATNDKIYKSPGGSFSVSGTSVYQAVTFIEVEYVVTFSESGLPSGTAWGISFNGSTLTSTNGTITIREPNGSYQYQVQIVNGYNSSPNAGMVTVSGNSASDSITWSLAIYAIAVDQSGIPNGTKWSVTLTGTAFNGQSVNITLNSTSNGVRFDVPNGTYTYSIHLPSGYSAKSSSQLMGSATVSGSLAKLSIQAQQNTNALLYIAIVVVVLVVVGFVFVLIRRKR